MSSKLYIGKLPYEIDENKNVEIDWYSECNLQFTKGLEILLTLEELQTAVKWLFLKRLLKYRETEVLLKDAEYLLENKDDLSDQGYSLVELMNSIKKNLGYHARDFDPESHEYSTGINILKQCLLTSKGDENADNITISNIMDWARSKFIEGEHYFYTI